MSYDIYLTDPITHKAIALDTPHQMRGGTYQVGGCPEMHLNVTYNYSPHFYRLINMDEGIRWLYGKTAYETMRALKDAVELLGDDIDDDYWKPTEGNAKRALLQLLSFAGMRPDGVWAGD